jgi:hypothetical protein
VNVDFGGALRLTVDEQGVRLERASLKTGETLTRYWRATSVICAFCATAPALKFSSTRRRGDEQPLFS